MTQLICNNENLWNIPAFVSLDTIVSKVLTDSNITKTKSDSRRDVQGHSRLNQVVNKTNVYLPLCLGVKGKLNTPVIWK